MGCSHPLRRKKLPYETDFSCNQNSLQTQSTQFNDRDGLDNIFSTVSSKIGPSSQKIVSSERRQSIYITNQTQIETRAHPSYSLESNPKRMDMTPSKDGNYQQNMEPSHNFSFGYENSNMVTPLIGSRFRCSSVGAVPTQKSVLMQFSRPLTHYFRKYEEYMNQNHHSTLMLSRSMNLPYLKSSLRFYFANISQLIHLEDEVVFQMMCHSIDELVREQLTDFSKKLWANQVKPTSSSREQVVQMLNSIYLQSSQQQAHQEIFWNHIIQSLHQKFR